MFSHITVGCQDLDRAGVFYDALLFPLGLKRVATEDDGGPPALCWAESPCSLPGFYAQTPLNHQPASAGNGNMVAFAAPSVAAVDEAYRAALAAHGTGEGKPGERPHYGRGYYGAYLRDPDGNKVHIVYRGDLA